MRYIRFAPGARSPIPGLVVAVLLLCLPASAGAAQMASVDRSAETLLSRGSGYDSVEGSTRVRQLQRTLRALGHRPGPIDGLYGPLTQGGVERFQAARGLSVDGIVGKNTGRQLRASGRAAAPAENDGDDNAQPVDREEYAEHLRRHPKDLLQNKWRARNIRKHSSNHKPLRQRIPDKDTVSQEVAECRNRILNATFGTTLNGQRLRQSEENCQKHDGADQSKYKEHTMPRRHTHQLPTKDRSGDWCYPIDQHQRRKKLRQLWTRVHIPDNRPRNHNASRPRQALYEAQKH